jgi:large subunit ribosomal protein L21
MYAIIQDGGRQYKVQPGQLLDLDYREIPGGETIRFERVVLVSSKEGVQVGSPMVAGVAVEAEVVGPRKGEKLVIQKFRRRKNYRRRTGHRQIHTRVRISRIHGVAEEAPESADASSAETNA